MKQAFASASAHNRDVLDVSWIAPLGKHHQGVILFYAEDMEDLAKQAAEQSNGGIKLGKIRWKCVRMSLNVTAVGLRAWAVSAHV